MAFRPSSAQFGLALFVALMAIIISTSGGLGMSLGAICAMVAGGWLAYAITQRDAGR